MISVSSESVLGLIMSMITSISSLMLLCLFSQYSSKIVVSVRPKLSWASSHFKCRVELIELSYVFTLNLFTIAESCTEK